MNANPTSDTRQHARLRLGTRGSKLALAQAHMVKQRLLAAHPGWEEADVAIFPFTTTGDKLTDVPLSEAGGKGLFTKELQEALLAGHIDFAVHSMKDMATVSPESLTITAVLEREDPRDAFISLHYPTLSALPQGAMFGTSSLRRQVQALHQRPDLRVVQFRGNVGTRLEKLERGVADATLLALAGLKRLGMTDKATQILDTTRFLPAVAQGIIALECRTDDTATRTALAPLHHTPTGYIAAAERAMLAVLDGSCRTPIAGLATINATTLTLNGMFATPDGSRCWFHEASAGIADAEALGVTVGTALRSLAEC